jgi:Polyketide cyclase / dehydrase and lipid transport
MLRSVLFAGISLGLAVYAMGGQPDSVAATGGWKFSSEKAGIKIFSRPHPGGTVKEFMAIGEIEACSREVHAVIDDIGDYSSFMPYTAECQLLKREADSILTYQRISPKVVCDRDYTLRIWETSWAGPDGFTFLNRWHAVNALGPPKKPGVLRVKLCEGSWLLEPASKTTTKATYSVCSDSCGKAPAFIANEFSQIGIRKVFAAVRQQVKDPKYSVAEQGEIRIGKRQSASEE